MVFASTVVPLENSNSSLSGAVFPDIRCAWVCTIVLIQYWACPFHIEPDDKSHAAGVSLQITLALLVQPGAVGGIDISYGIIDQQVIGSYHMKTGAMYTQPYHV